jgi:hypothetical protein
MRPGTLNSPPPSTNGQPDAIPGRGLTVADVARRYRVGEDKIRNWIASGQLRALNVASTLCGRRRWVVLPESLAEFEDQRAGGPPVKPAPRRRRRAELVDYFPGD